MKEIPTKEENWYFQVNWKLGQHLFNARVYDERLEKLLQLLGQIEGQSEAIMAGIYSLDRSPNLPIAAANAEPPVQVPLPVPTPASAPRKPQSTDGKEVGPIVVSGITEGEVVAGANALNPGQRFPKWNVEFGHGALEAETLKEKLIAEVKSLIGKNCFARVEKTKWGYKLIAIRPAA